MLCTYVDVQLRTWDDVLLHVTFAYSTAIHKTMQMTPLELVHGRLPTTLLNAILPHEESDDLTPTSKNTFSVRRRPAKSLEFVQWTSSWWMPCAKTSNAQTPSTSKAIVFGFELPSDDAEKVTSLSKAISHTTRFYDLSANLPSRWSPMLIPEHHDFARPPKSSTWFAWSLSKQYDELFCYLFVVSFLLVLKVGDGANQVFSSFIVCFYCPPTPFSVICVPSEARLLFFFFMPHGQFHSEKENASL